MKYKFLFSLFLIPLFMMFSGCRNNNEEPQVVDTVEAIDLNQYVEFRAAAQACVPDLLELNYLARSSTRALVVEKQMVEKCLQIQDIILPYATVVIHDIGFTIQDINEMFETNYQYLEQADTEVTALALFMDLIQPNEVETRGGSFGDCFLEASGIAAGMTIIYSLGSQAIGKATVKALVKSITKIVGKQVLGGVGLLLFVGEMVWCMNN